MSKLAEMVKYNHAESVKPKIVIGTQPPEGLIKRIFTSEGFQGLSGFSTNDEANNHDFSKFLLEEEKQGIQENQIKMTNFFSIIKSLLKMID